MLDHELNGEGTDCAADCPACLKLQAKKLHQEAHLPEHGLWNKNCPACRKFDEWLAQRIPKPEAEKVLDTSARRQGPPDAKLLEARWASHFGEKEDFTKAMEKLC